MNAAAETIVRLLLLLTGGAVLGMSAFVLWLYGMVNVLERRGGRSGTPPYHVWAISTSYILLVVVTMLRHLIQGLWVLWPLVICAYVFGLLALHGALRYEQTRIHRMLKEEKPGTST